MRCPETGLYEVQLSKIWGIQPPRLTPRTIFKAVHRADKLEAAERRTGPVAKAPSHLRGPQALNVPTKSFSPFTPKPSNRVNPQKTCRRPWLKMGDWKNRAQY